ncbi:hypothetical protein L2E82_10958 [Cichorium intybus]|uniref:Uncharacterized protein n=2 Tax=Cichorium intybus TaxID=13427 RepID=A0ACB9GD23_CICIN|nr:hypothetical protein L2E82_10956 [Cichorium intybus]KAI3780963.1 hypothetical protein L2E82_10958 [Cichorium intybus]
MTLENSFTLKCTKPEFLRGEPNLGKKPIRFPAALKTLSISGCLLPWSDMSVIQSLPNLEGLLLEHNGFEGTLWETGEKQFQQLNFLRLYDLNIKQWEASSLNFPCLERLEVVGCVDLEEIPLELGDISTLQTIYVSDCAPSLRLSLLRIQKEQYDVGNCQLKIIVDRVEMPSFTIQHALMEQAFHSDVPSKERGNKHEMGFYGDLDQNDHGEGPSKGKGSYKPFILRFSTFTPNGLK